MLSVVSAVSGSVVAEVPREKVWGKEVKELKKALAPQVALDGLSAFRAGGWASEIRITR